MFRLKWSSQTRMRVYQSWLSWEFSTTRTKEKTLMNSRKKIEHVQSRWECMWLSGQTTARVWTLSQKLSFLFGPCLRIDSLFDSQNAIVYSMIVFFFAWIECRVENRYRTVCYPIDWRKQQCDINETLFCSGSTEHIFIEITKHQGRLQQNKIPLSKSHLQQHFPFLSSNF